MPIQSFFVFFVFFSCSWHCMTICFHPYQWHIATICFIHPQRRNVTTLMVGLKKRSHTQKSHPKVVNPRDIAGERKKKKKKKALFICIQKLPLALMQICFLLLFPLCSQLFLWGSPFLVRFFAYETVFFF